MKSFWADRRANFGIMTALLLVPLIGMAGLAIDAGRALVVKSQLDLALDAAAIGSITMNSASFAQALKLPEDGTYTLDPAEAVKFLTSQVPSIGGRKPAVTVSLKRSGSTIMSDVTYTSEVPTVVLSILGKDSIPVSGAARATLKIPPYLDFYMLIDNSPSMAIGATTADVNLMVNVIKCQFGCHIVSEEGVEETGSEYHRAKNAGATMRIDVVTRSLRDFVAQTKLKQATNGQIRMAAHTFGLKATYPDIPPLHVVSELTTNLDALSQDIEQIKLMSVPYGEFPQVQTSYKHALARMNEVIKTVGNGESVGSRQPVLMILGDGLEDTENPSPYCTGRILSGVRCVEPVRQQECNALKQRGVIISVVHTPYIALAGNPAYINHISKFASKIPQNLKDCASPNMFVEVTPTKGIGAALDEIFTKLVTAPVLTH